MTGVVSGVFDLA